MRVAIRVSCWNFRRLIVFMICRLDFGACLMVWYFLFFIFVFFYLRVMVAQQIYCIYTSLYLYIWVHKGLGNNNGWNSLGLRNSCFFLVLVLYQCVWKSLSPFGFLNNEPDIHILTSLYNYNYTMLRVGGHLTSIY